MFGIGLPELLIILVVALIFIGPKRLPEVARTVGKGYRELQKAMSSLKEEYNNVESTIKEGVESIDPRKALSTEQQKAPPAKTEQPVGVDPPVEELAGEPASPNIVPQKAKSSGPEEIRKESVKVESSVKKNVDTIEPQITKPKTKTAPIKKGKTGKPKGKKRKLETVRSSAKKVVGSATLSASPKSKKVKRPRKKT